MENKYAILDSNNKVVNVVFWNGDTSIWQPPAGTTAIPFSQVTSDNYTTPSSIEEYTAEEWIINQGYQDSRPTACLYFKLQLDAVNKVSPKLNAVQNWMNSILAEGVINPDNKRSDWTPAPYTFQEANTEALQVLNS